MSIKKDPYCCKFRGLFLNMFDTLKIEVFVYLIIRNIGLIFKPLFSDGNYRKRAFNPDKNYILLHGYAPKLTIYEKLYNGNWEVYKFEVECSLRKLLNNTSYFGNDESGVDEIIKKLIGALAAYGLDCTPADIEKGNVLIIAYCFNFYLPPQFAKPKEFILPLIHLDIGKRTGNLIEKLWLQVLPGYGIKFYNKFRGISFYDKGVELANTAMPTKQDKKIVHLIKAGQLQECFEIENTLQNRKAVKQGIAIFYDKDEKKERHIREVLRNDIAMRYLKNVFQRLSDPANVKALETKVYPLEDYHLQMTKAGMSFNNAMLFLAHSIHVQQMGSLRLMQIADSYSKYGRQYRQYYDKKIEAIASKIKGLRLSDFFDYCKKQLDNPKILKPQDVSPTN